MPDTTYYYRVGGVINDSVFGYSLEEAGKTDPTPDPTPTPTPVPTPVPTETPVPENLIFYDGFDNGLGQWDYINRAQVTENAWEFCPRIRLKKNGTIEKNISTSGWENIHISFYLGYKNLEPGESMNAAWKNGDDRYVIEKMTVSKAINKEIAYFEGDLSTEAANLPEFKLRFHLNGSCTDDYGFIDEVLLTGDIMPTPAPPLMITGISCDLDFTDNCGYTDHWLPNTGDYLALSSVTVIGIDDQDADVIITEPFNNIIIRPPLDPEWETNDADSNNIHRNKGTCRYEFYVIYSNGDERILTTFYKNNAVSEQYFQINYTDTYFYDTSDAQLNGMAKHEDGYYLQTRVAGDNPGRLYFRDENRPGDQEETEDFRIRVAVNGGYTIRPGDDMQLRFGVAGYPEYDTEVSAGDFMAVYDHKLLWRANLFIDENDFTITGYDGDVNAMSNTLGEADWNDANPWPVGNDWNRIHRGTSNYITNYSTRYPVGNQNSTYCADNLTGLATGDGGQVLPIQKSTLIFLRIHQQCLHHPRLWSFLL